MTNKQDTDDLAPLILDKYSQRVLVFKLPKYISREFCHGGGIPTTFTLVDWFDDSVIPIPHDDMREIIRGKNYYNSECNYLVFHVSGKSYLVDKPTNEKPL